MPFSLLVTDLELTFIKDLHDYLVIRETRERGLDVLLLWEFTFTNIRENFVYLEDLIDVPFLFTTPIQYLVVVAGKLEALPTFLKSNHLDIS